MNVERNGLNIDQFSRLVSVEKAVTLLTQKQHMACEYLHDHVVTKLYLDRDYTFECKDPSDVERQKEEQLNIVTDRLDQICDVMAKRIPDCGNLTYKIATRHGPKDKHKYKLSFRPFISGIRLRYTDIPYLLNLLDQDDGFWDMSVYKPSEQLLACILGRKSMYDQRILRPQEDTDDIRLYLAQFVDEKWPFGEFVTGEYTPASMGSAINQCEADVDLGLVNALSTDPGICAFFGLTGTAIQMRKASFDAKFNTTNCQVKSRLQCPIAKRVHQSNTSAISICHVSGQIAYHCHDHECHRQVNKLDITKHASPDLVCAISNAFIVEYDEADQMAPPQRNAKRSSLSIDLQNQDTSYIPTMMKQRWPDMFDDYDDNTFLVVRTTWNRLEFTWQKFSGFMTRNSSIIDCSGRFMGMLVPNHVIKGPFTHIHKDIPIAATECAYNQIDCSNSTLTSTTPNVDVSISLYNIEECKTVIVRSAGKKDIIITNAKKIKELQELICRSSEEFVTRAIGSGFYNVFQINIVNNGSIIIGNASSEDTDPEVIVDIALQHHSSIFDRIRFVPELKSSNCNGIYYCNPDTCIWQQKTNPEMEQLVINTLRFDNNLSGAQAKYLSSRRGRNDMLYCIASKKIDSEFANKLNSDLNLFPCSNGVFDMKQKAFRPICMADNIRVTTGWKYDPELSALHRPDVERFLKQVFPYDDERRAILTYNASLMSGDRKMKKFPILTDRRSGNNGKSTYKELLAKFFGKLCTQKGIKIISKAAIEGDRNSHDAGLESLKGLRLIIADELDRNKKLDMGFLKWITSGMSVDIEGRSCGTQSNFVFQCQAGVMLIFNEGQCPQFDVDDEPFIQRLLVVPMRSRFVKDAHNIDEPHTFEKDSNIIGKFPSWLSAFADILLDYFNANGDIDVPDTMNEWQDALSTENNKLAALLEDHIEVSGSKHDYIIRENIKNMFQYQLMNIPRSEFNKLYKSYFSKLKGAKYVEKTDIENRHNVSGVVRGVKLKVTKAKEDDDVFI